MFSAPERIAVAEMQTRNKGGGGSGILGWGMQ